MNINIKIAAEIREARKRGDLETRLRPFVNIMEQYGAMRCCRSKCRKPSTHVTYLCGFHGRLAFCDFHTEEHRKSI